MTDMVEWIKCVDDEQWEAARRELLPERISSTESPVLFGASPWVTAFELYHRKKAPEHLPSVDNAAMRWGRRLQDSIAAGVAQDHGWDIERDLSIAVRRDAPMMSSFDFRMYDNARGYGRLEIKNVSTWAWHERWTAEEAPAYVEIQLQHQLETADDATWGAIVAFVGGNSPVVYTRERDTEVGRVIRTRCQRFMTDVSMQREPAPDFGRDCETIIDLYKHTKEGMVVDFTGDANVEALLKAYKAASEINRNSEEQRTRLRAELLFLMGEAQLLVCNGTTLKANTVAAKEGRPPNPGELIGARSEYKTLRFLK